LTDLRLMTAWFDLLYSRLQNPVASKASGAVASTIRGTGIEALARAGLAATYLKFETQRRRATPA